jgi:hypothetical protein
MTKLKLSKLTPEQKTRLLAELDRRPIIKGLESTYLTSYDAIIPLIRKLGLWLEVHNCIGAHTDCTYALDATPSQLCDAVLVATGKAEV